MDLTVNHSTLDSAATDLQSGAQKIENELNTMDAELKQLSTNWEGEAKEAYAAAKAKWTEGMTGMREVLARISTQVSTANQNYRETDKRNASMFQ